jgi:hypothetical protein
LFFRAKQEFILGQIMDFPQHVVGPGQGIFRHIHIDLFVVFHEQIGSFVKVGFLGGMFSNIGKGFFNRFAKVFHPGHQIQQLRDGQVGQFVAFRAPNLFQNLFGTNVGDTSTPQGFQGPIGGKAAGHLILDKDNFGRQTIASAQDGGKVSPGGFFVVVAALLFRLEKRK